MSARHLLIGRRMEPIHLSGGAGVGPAGGGLRPAPAFQRMHVIAETMTKRTFWLALVFSGFLHLAPVCLFCIWAWAASDPVLLQGRGNADQEGTPLGVISLTPGSYYSDPDLPPGKEQQPAPLDRELPTTGDETDLTPPGPAEPEMSPEQPPAEPARELPEPAPARTQSPEPEPVKADEPIKEAEPKEPEPQTKPEAVKEPEPPRKVEPIKAPKEEPKPATQPMPQPSKEVKSGQGKNSAPRTKAELKIPGKGKGTLSPGAKRSGGHETRNVLGGSPLAPGIPTPGGKQGVPDGLAILSRPPKTMPLEARIRGWEGTPIVDIAISDRGFVVSARLHRSCGYPILDKAAVEWVKGLRWLPARRFGSPISVKVYLPVEYELRNQ